ncbi:MAG TPA: glycosyltransferase family 2 protein [Thermoanaerobaculia bacterium]|nr:glycosyltransferase family 2 protein [Thermoanaerobaculia bacterium]
MSEAPSPRISVCIVCRNEADRLGPCLESVAWADEVILMDLESADGSAELACRHGARVISRAPVPIVEWVRNELAAQAVGEWILALDPDERITPGLARELRRVAERDDLDAVVIPRMNYDLGYPPSNPYERYEPQLRMYRRSRVTWPTAPNKLPQVPDERRYQIAARDELVMVHDRSRNIPEVLDRIVRYAPLQARSMIDRGEVFTARAMLTSLGSRTYRQLVLGKAWRDGVPGLLRVGILVGFHFYVWAAFWQLSGARRTPEDDRFVRRLGLAVEGARRAWRAGTLPYRWGKRLLRGARRTLRPSGT